MFRKPDGAGKGDAPRPTDWEKFSNNFDAIFGKKKNEQPTKTSQATNDDESDVAGGVRPSDTPS